MNYFLVTKAVHEEYDIFVGHVLEMRTRYLSDWDGTDTWEEHYVDLNGGTAQLWEDVEGFFLTELRGEEREMYKMLYPSVKWGK